MTTQDLPKKSSRSSFLQLFIFTAFLFLLVAIPYTIYLKSSAPKTVTLLTTLPVIKPSPMPTITPPPASTTTTCIPVPTNYQLTQATPSAYFFQDAIYQLCYPPSLPPFPFIWKPLSDFKYHYTIDTPSNWIDNTRVINNIFVRMFTSEENASPDATPTISFGYYYNQSDPYATDSSYLKMSGIYDGQPTTIYTKTSSFIAAIIPAAGGYFMLQASRMDSAFYAFQHMLTSLKYR